jgi:hypothetical protein
LSKRNHTNMTTSNILRAVLATIPAAALVACGGGTDSTAESAGASEQALAAKTTTETAQGIWVDLQGTNDLSIQRTEVYQYDPTAAAALVSNTLVSDPVRTCAGPGCGATTLPLDPNAPTTAPDPDAAKVQALITAGGNSSFKCSLLDGSPVSGTTYTQKISTAKIGSGNSAVTYTYTWSYAVTPSQSTYEPRTAWVLKSSQGDGTASVEIGGDVAGQSVLVKGGVSKYSFSLADDAGYNRVTGLNIAVLAASDNAVLASAATASTLVSNAPGAQPGDPAAVDFLYESHNGGTNGDPSLLKTGMQAREILNTDGFAGNNDGGADGKALAKAVITPVPFQLGEGQYLVQLTGTVKGNTASATSSAFQIQKALRIVGVSCGNAAP